MVKKVKEVMKMLEEAGWVRHHDTGSHRIYKKNGRSIPVPGKPSKDLAKGTYASIMRSLRGT